MVIYDSVQKKRVKFTPINKDEVKIYVCGPTVYDDAHLGHARSAIAFDLLRRVFCELGFKVTFVKNFTDIDDKIINKIKDSGKSLKEITEFYIKRYKDEMHQLGVKDADIEPKATESIEDIVRFIEALLEKDIAYKTKDTIYFDTSKDKKYLSLSHMQIDDAKARVEGDEQKRDPKDFALWKFKKEGEPSFNAPFGEGRPGWHIECSAMIEKHLANSGEYQIDIHAGGADLLFPHHENEASQTRCKSNQELAKYWMHNGFVTIDGEKMSKSLGNSFFLKDALKVYDGEILRFYLLSSHYRANFNFNEEDLQSSKKRLDKIYRLKKRVFVAKSGSASKEFKESMLEALSEDLNISKALSLVDEMVSKANENLDLNPKDKALKAQISANIGFLEPLLGVGAKNPYEYFQIGISKEEKEEIEKLIEMRNSAKKEKNYALADKIRDELKSKNIAIMDTPSGTVWERVI